MELTVLESSDTGIRAGYTCSCGCTPSVQYARDSEIAQDSCCCGNRFAVGPRAAASLAPVQGFRPELQTFQAPWGEGLEAAWLVGPGVHGPSGDHDHDEHLPEDGNTTAHVAIDPVCGMTVQRGAAESKGLRSSYKGIDYYFCGKGCLLEFGAEPERYLDPSHVPSM